MIVMPGNSWVHELSKQFPNCLGMLFGPGEVRDSNIRHQRHNKLSTSKADNRMGKARESRV